MLGKLWVGCPAREDAGTPPNLQEKLKFRDEQYQPFLLLVFHYFRPPPAEIWPAMVGEDFRGRRSTGGWPDGHQNYQK